MTREGTVGTGASAQATRAAVEAYVRAWASGDRNALLEAFAEDATWVDPVGTPPWIGRARIGEFWDGAHANGAELTPEVQRIVVCGNEAILLFRMIVRTSGGGMYVDACDHMIVNEAGKIQSGRAFWDQGCIGPLTDSAR